MKIDAPLFSIVTITRDNLSGLIKTAHSITQQSCSNFEWIVIDGASTDGTKYYLQTLKAQITSEPDKGIYDAMNKGILQATGDYIIFMNAGDCFSDTDILSTLEQVIAAHNPDFIYGDALETNGFYKKARQHEKAAWGMFTHHQAMLYRRELIGDLRYDDRLKIAADYGFTIAFLKKARQVHYVPCAICIFEDGGISQQRRTLGRREQFIIRRDHGQYPPIKNAVIYGVQCAAALLRERWPQIYISLRG